MSEKSQKTEEEMLEQTFGTYDADMTVETDAATVQTSNGQNAAGNTKKPINSNLLIVGGVGLAAVALIGFKFMGGSNQQPQAEPIQPIQQVQPMEQPAAPVEQPPAQPVVQTPVDTATPDTSAAAQYLSNTNPLAPKTDKVEEVKPVVQEPVVVTPVVVAPVQEVQPVVVAPKVDVSTNPNVVASNASQSGVTNELKSLFEKQTQEIKGAVENVGNRVEKLEQSMAKQESTNRSIEERLTSLESGKVAVIKPVAETSDTNVVKAKPKAKKAVVKNKRVVKTVVKREHTSVLVDKSSNNEVKAEASYPSLEIHSVFGDRIWTKNKDGSLSTFTVGEKLPSGEVIKKIDDNKFKVTTDKRVLTK